MNQNLGIYAVMAAFVLSFGGAFVWIQSQRPDAPATVNGPDAPAPADPPPEPAKKDSPPEPARKEVVTKPPTPTRPTLIKRWQLPQPPKPRGEESLNYERYFCREIGVDQTGSRVVTQTQLEAACWDAATGARLHTYTAASRTVPRKPPDKPELHIDEELFITRDARIVARVRRDGKAVILNEATTGRLIGTYQTPKDMSCYLDHYPPAFTPRGDYLLMMHNHGALAAVNTSTARGGVLRLAPDWGKAHTQMWRVLIGAPNDSALIRHTTNRQGIFVLDLNTSQERRLSSVTIEPFSLFENCGIKLSPNGRYLSARSGQFVVVDWKADRLVMKQTGGHFSDWFTPDGKRLLVACDTDIIQYQIYPSHKRLTPRGGWLDLYDVEKGVKIGTCTPQHHGLTNGIRAIAFSGDGKKFALGDAMAGVALLDFEMAFGVPPLPPLPRPQPESLPLR